LDSNSDLAPGDQFSKIMNLARTKKRLLAEPLFHHHQHVVPGPLIPRQAVPEGLLQSARQRLLLKGDESQWKRSQKTHELSIL
jgi:hypothetical protein